MGRKVDKQGTAAGKETVSEIVEVDGEEIAAEGIEAERALREWVARENPESLTVLSYVYKYDSPTTGDNKVLCDRIEGEIPDPHTIGCQYGGGRYLLIVSIPRGQNQDRKVRGLRFRLHARYDELKRTSQSGQWAGQSAAPAVPAVPAVVSPLSGLKESMEIVRSVVEIIRPLLDAKAQSAAAVPDVGKLLEGQYELLRGVMKKSLEDTQELIGEVNRARLEGGNVECVEEDTLDRWLPWIERFLPLVLGGGPQGKAAAAVVGSLPEVRRVVSDAGQLRRVVAWMDESIGREKTDRVLGALKVKRPPDLKSRTNKSVPKVGG